MNMLLLKKQNVSIKKHLLGFVDYLKVYCDYRPTTISSTMSKLKLADEWLSSNGFAFDQESFEKFILHHKQKGTHCRYVEAFIETARRFCSYLVEKRIIQENWAKKMPVPRRISKIPLVLSLQEITKLVETPRQYRYKPELQKLLYNTAIGLLSKTGMRVGELTNLLIQDLDFGNRTIRIRETKTRRERLIPMPPDLTGFLRGLVIKRDSTDSVFIGVMSKKKLPIRLINNELHMRAKICGIQKPVHAHILRHSFINEMLRANPPGGVAVISKIVGHASPMLTLTTYQHLIIEDMQIAIIFHPLIKKNLNPLDRIETVKHQIKNHRFGQDKRFAYQLVESEDGIECFSLKVKK